jgi:hypothetical protein
MKAKGKKHSKEISVKMRTQTHIIGSSLISSCKLDYHLSKNRGLIFCPYVS